MKLIEYFKKWNSWRKHNLNSKFYKFLVLLKLQISSTYEMHLTKEQIERIQNSVLQGLEKTWFNRCSKESFDYLKKGEFLVFDTGKDYTMLLKLKTDNEK